MSNKYRIQRLRAEAYRFLQATALIKLYGEGRLCEKTESPIDPYKWLTAAEENAAITQFVKG